MANSHKKGSRFESEVVKFLIGAGHKAYKVLLSGAGNTLDDIVIGHSPHIVRPTDLRVECKIRKKLPEWIAEAMSSSGLVVMREDRGKRTWMLSDEVFLSLLGAYEKMRHLGTDDDLDRILLIMNNAISEIKKQRKAELSPRESKRLKKSQKSRRK